MRLHIVFICTSWLSVSLSFITFDYEQSLASTLLFSSLVQSHFCIHGATHFIWELLKFLWECFIRSVFLLHFFHHWRFLFFWKLLALVFSSKFGAESHNAQLYEWQDWIHTHSLRTTYVNRKLFVKNIVNRRLSFVCHNNEIVEWQSVLFLSGLHCSPYRAPMMKKIMEANCLRCDFNYLLF